MSQQIEARLSSNSPHAGLNFVQRRSVISKRDGTVLYDLSVIAPENWSQTAVDMIAQKYLRKAGVPDKTTAITEEKVPEWLWRRTGAPDAKYDRETDSRQVFHRIAGCWTYWGWKLGYFLDEAQAKNYYDEIVFMLANQMMAPNSPQWFNTGLNYAYGITGDDRGMWGLYGDDVKAIDDAYSRPASGACFIQTLDDTLVGPNGITDFIEREARIFSNGAGSGANYSELRGAGEPLSGGGTSSGLLSFLKPIDASAGAIKSGGTCLAPDTRVFTDRGVVPVSELEASGERFVCLSYDPPAGRYKAKWAEAFKSGRKMVVLVKTDKGEFRVSHDHPMRLACGEYAQAVDLVAGQRLFACHVANRNGYLRVSLRTGKRGGGSRYWHRLIGEDVLGASREMVVDHADDNKHNNLITNLELKSSSDHARRHGRALAAVGNHVFQQRKFPKCGASNPMASGAAFWTDTVKVASYKAKQADRIQGRAEGMALLSSRQKMLNYAWKCLNAGQVIDSFSDYVKAREVVCGRIGCKKTLLRTIESRFGSYAEFLREVNSNNHRVVSVTEVGEMDVYDVQVDCPTTDEKVPESGHNFVIWSGDNPEGSGVAVHNTRRAARMVVLDVDHPDIEDFIGWKAREEKKVAALVAGSRLVKRNVDAVYKEKDPTRQKKLIAKAVKEGVPYGTLKAVKLAAQHGQPCPQVDEFDTDYEKEAYQTVSGQNANNSVRISDKFMEAVLGDREWHLYYRTELRKAKKERRTPKPCKSLNARDLWTKIARASWECADPGVQFDDAVNDWNPVINDSRIRATNPCCFVGETIVDTSEGKLRIDELVAMCDRGEILPYAFGHDRGSKSLALKPIKRAWCAGRTRTLVRVTTDKGVQFTCTPEHKVLTFNGDYIEAQNLAVGTSLRKIPRHVNVRRSGRVMVTDSKAGTPNGTQYQNIWMWEKVNGPIPENMEVHHKNDDPADDRVSNFELVDRIEHRKYHSAGENNPRFLDVDESLLVEAYETLTTTGKGKVYGRFTVGRWNKMVQEKGWTGRLPLARRPKGANGIVQGMSWEAFESKLKDLRQKANDKVALVEHIALGEEVPVYDLEVEGTHNFAVTNSTSPATQSIVVSNSEFNFIDDSTCNLSCLNLVKAVVRDGDVINWPATVERLRHMARLTTIGLDITVSMSSYPSEAIANGAYKYRTIGLGYANLGALLMQNGIPYDSVEGRAWAVAFTGVIHYQSTLTSIALAQSLGSFPQYANNIACVNKVLNNHAQYVLEEKYEDLTYPPPSAKPLLDALPAVLREKLQDVARSTLVVLDEGLRNAQLTLVQPAGTVGLLMDCDCTGVEPDFALVKGKQLAGGGWITIVNQSVTPALKKLGYSDADVATICDHVLKKGTVEGCEILKAEHLPVFDCAVPCTKGGGVRSISADGHMDMLAAVQPLLSGSCSKTLNLDHDVTVAEVERVHMKCWKDRIKCAALYRDGSKLSQPLNAGDQADVSDVEDTEDKETKFEATKRRYLPSRRRGYTQKFRVPGHKLYLRTGEYDDGTIGEIFLTAHKDGALLQSVLGALAQAVSIGLQYGVPLSEFIDAYVFTQFEPNGPVSGHEKIKNCTSLLDAIFRDLGIEYGGRTELAHVIPQGKEVPTKSITADDAGAEVKYEGTPCRHCGQLKLIRNGTCLVCVACGTTTGCA